MSCLACVAGAWKWWAQERTGRASDTRVSSRGHGLPYMLQGHVSQAPFHSYGVRRHLVNRARNDLFHKNKEKLFSIRPPNYPRKFGKWPLQATPHPLARRAGLVPVDAHGVVTSPVEPCINDILENQKPLSLFSPNCAPPFRCFFRFYWNFRPWRSSQPQELVIGFWHNENKSSSVF